MNSPADFFSPHRAQNLALVTTLAIFIGLSAASAQDEPFYHFSFKEGAPEDTGSEKTALEEGKIQGASNLFSIVKDEKINRYAAELPMTDNGERGASLIVVGSENALRMDGDQDEMTLSCWIKWNGPDKHNDLRQGIITTMPMEKNAGWGFFVQDSGRLGFFWINHKGGGNMRLSSDVIPLNEWTHISMTWRNHMPSNGLRFFINGNPAGIDMDYTAGGPLKPSDLPITIGVLDTKSYLPLNGAIADIRLYNRALEDESVFQVFQASEN